MAVKVVTYTSPYDPDGIAQETSYVDDEILVTFADTATPEEIAAFEESQGLQRDREIGGGTILYKTATDPIELVVQQASNPIIEVIEPNLIRTAATTPTQRTDGDTFQNMGLFAVAFVLGLILFARK